MEKARQGLVLLSAIGHDQAMIHARTSKASGDRKWGWWPLYVHAVKLHNGLHARDDGFVATFFFFVKHWSTRARSAGYELRVDLYGHAIPMMRLVLHIVHPLNDRVDLDLAKPNTVWKKMTSALKEFKNISIIYLLTFIKYITNQR